MVRIGINGFGRIGRLAFRAAWEQKLALELVAINDPAGAHTDALLLEFDSNYGPFPAKVQSEEGAMRGDGKRLAVFRERDWTKLNWSDVGAEIILECSGRGTRRAEAEKHLAAGAKRVLISAPAKDEDLTIVLGVNEGQYDPALHRIISNGSFTTKFHHHPPTRPRSRGDPREGDPAARGPLQRDGLSGPDAPRLRH